MQEITIKGGEVKTLEARCRDILAELGLNPDSAPVTVQPLSGGVASDIARVDVGKSVYCVKFALPKLRVKADWYAPVERNLAEYRWLTALSSVAPESSLKLFGHSRAENGFVMEYLSGPDTVLLKSELMAGRGTAQQAHKTGALLGQLHQHSTSADFDSAGFHNQDDFHALRLEPYLVHTALSHPELAPALHQMADALYQADTVLIHGDVSPKNILFSQNKPFILDAECATLGDPCFDLAFCMTHFMLKACHLPDCRTAYHRLVPALWQGYLPFIRWEDSAGLERRVCQLLPMLMLARIDGKSPVEYLSDETKSWVRSQLVRLIKQPATNFADLILTFEDRS